MLEVLLGIWWCFSRERKRCRSNYEKAWILLQGTHVGGVFGQVIDNFLQICINYRSRQMKISTVSLWIFSYPSVKTYVVGAQKNCLNETVLLSTHNISVGWEARKLTIDYALIWWEGSGSVVECLTRDRRAVGSSLTGVTALCPWARTLILA